MRAVVCKQWGGPEKLVIETIADLVPGPDEVVIDVKAAGVNFPDVLIIQNKYQMKPPLPFTPGAELAGIVRCVGSEVQHLQIGDAVVAFAGLGAFAQQCLSKADRVMPMPPGMDFNTAAAFTLAYGTSWHAVRDRAALKAQETMLVLGAAGGVGLAAVEIGKAIGATVIACASTQEKLQICKDHGADHCINYESEDLRSRIKELTQGRGPDVVYDPVGGKFSEICFRAIGWRGRYLVVGFANGEIPSLPMNLALLKGASIVGVFWGEFIQREPKNNAAGLTEMLLWMKQGKIKPLISKIYPLDQTPQALIDMSERKVTGKIIITP